MTRVDNAHLRFLAVGAFSYALVRFIESFGLWRGRRWAEWFGVLSGCIYLPLEIYKLFERHHLAADDAFCANCIVVAIPRPVLLRDPSVNLPQTPAADEDRAAG